MFHVCVALDASLRRAAQPTRSAGPQVGRLSPGAVSNAGPIFDRSQFFAFLCPTKFPFASPSVATMPAFPLSSPLPSGLRPLVTSLIDCGTNSEASCDYPDFAIAVARQLIEGTADRGIVVCGSGVGVSVAANKIPGIRAAICHDTYSAHQGVEHDDMNVLCIGGRIIGSELAFEIVEAFLKSQVRAPRPSCPTASQSPRHRKTGFGGPVAIARSWT